jgi:hypothetical protein
MPRRAKTPEIVIVVVLAFLVAGGLAAGRKGPDDSATAGAKAAAASVGPIARRVEQIRGLRFKRLPVPAIVSPAQTRRDSLADLDRSGSAAERRRGAQVLELLGLLEPGTDLRAVASDVAGEQVAGYYDTKRKRLAIVSGPGASDKVLSEITLAHELDHALEDQAIGLRDELASGADDQVSAYTALVEGSATSVMDDYSRRFIGAGSALGSAFSAAGGGASSTDGIPPYLLSSLLFSYVVGEKFVKRLRSVAHGWKLVNYALAHRPPASTEQVIHPDKYLTNEAPVRLAPFPLKPMLPAAWQRRAAGTIGEFDTDQLLKLGLKDVPAGDAAAGWGGGRYELWSPSARGPSSGCDTTCRSDSVLVVSWAWDTPADAAEFESGLRSYLEAGLSARKTGALDEYEVGDGAAAMRASGLRTTLAFAPAAVQAGRLASGVIGR